MVDPKILVRKVFSSPYFDELEPIWDEVLSFAGINTDDRLVMYLAQIGVESGYMKSLTENLHYSAQRMANIWPRKFAEKDSAGKAIKVGKNYTPSVLAHKIEYNPVEVANYAYAGVNGNGLYSTGDGYKYRGRGFKMITGKGNYRECTKFMWPQLKIDFVLEPDKMAEPKNALWTTSWFWITRGLSKYADLGYKGVDPCTLVLNGGYNGLEDRKKLYEKIRRVLSTLI